MTGKDEQRHASYEDRRVVERLVPAWLEETERHDGAAAREARSGWGRVSLSDRSAQDLAHWVTARVTDTAFNEDEGPYVEGSVRITPADKEAVHRWLTAQGHRI
ncbi:hypothetical protein [Streptomyces resistomycificus]|uniref:Uncharacterized protein n=1 Tax=Streptomyces resistomycificus TaxID=67356 RepID=A0A0L8LWR8_9ACTN|nr:hypothetical protein [Streptomyces resistomycificus]KOG42520.1 hypothetical protein ADK37_05240 [Streptomyces resistomycificus]KUN92672.1 hypothetical protein AQJ84_32345 [Streptomyces resistomycificus]